MNVVSLLTKWRKMLLIRNELMRMTQVHSWHQTLRAGYNVHYLTHEKKITNVPKSPHFSCLTDKSEANHNWGKGKPNFYVIYEMHIWPCYAQFSSNLRKQSGTRLFQICTYHSFNLIKLFSKKKNSVERQDLVIQLILLKN